MAEVIDLTPPQRDLKGIRAGDANIIEMAITFKGDPLDLTDYTVRAQARKTPLDDNALEAIITVLDAVNGELVMRWDGDDVRDMMGNELTWSGVWDIQIDNGEVVTVLAGKFSAVMDVTR